MCIADTDADMAVMRLGRHNAFPRGYPKVKLEDFDEVHEGMEIARCGFPLGNLLFETLGTVTGSFSRGILSSIVPSAGMPLEDVSGFQLDLRSTHGNSGGPVFSKQTGRVFGILTGGISDKRGANLFAYAGSVYTVIRKGTIKNVLSAKNPPI